MTKSLRITNDIGQISQLEPFAEEICDEFGLDMALSFQIQLVLDEAVSNVVNYAYGDKKDMPIQIDAYIGTEPSQRKLFIEVIDEGFEFNPLEHAPEVDTSLGIEEREIGGLGLFLIRQTMDDVTYERKGEKNILRMAKALS